MKTESLHSDALREQGFTVLNARIENITARPHQYRDKFEIVYSIRFYSVLPLVFEPTVSILSGLAELLDVPENLFDMKGRYVRLAFDSKQRLCYIGDIIKEVWMDARSEPQAHEIPDDEKDYPAQAKEKDHDAERI